MTHTTEQERAEFHEWKLRDNPKYKQTDDSMQDRRDWLVWQAARRAPAVPTRKQIEQYLYEQGAVTVSRDVAEAAGLARLAGKMQSASAAPVQQMFDALEKIIGMNIQYCIDKYGDASKAESMACVQVARKALAAAPKPPEADHIPDAGKMVAALVQLPEPVAKIDGGSLKWHIPDAGYSLPVRYLQGTQMLYTDHQALSILAQHGIKTK